jgi:hypothetical protein
MQTQQANTAQTSAQALNALGPRNVKRKLDQIHDICIAAQRNGRGDMSGKEIQHQYEFVHAQRIDASIISARVNDLIAAGRLERCAIARMCLITGREIHPVRVPATQSRLVG